MRSQKVIRGHSRPFFKGPLVERRKISNFRFSNALPIRYKGILLLILIYRYKLKPDTYLIKNEIVMVIFQLEVT